MINILKNYLMRKHKETGKHLHQSETVLLRSPEEILKIQRAKADARTME